MSAKAALKRLIARKTASQWWWLAASTATMLVTLILTWRISTALIEHGTASLEGATVASYYGEILLAAIIVIGAGAVTLAITTNADERTTNTVINATCQAGAIALAAAIAVALALNPLRTLMAHDPALGIVVVATVAALATWIPRVTRIALRKDSTQKTAAPAVARSPMTHAARELTEPTDPAQCREAMDRIEQTLGYLGQSDGTDDELLARRIAAALAWHPINAHRLLASWEEAKGQLNLRYGEQTACMEWVAEINRNNNSPRVNLGVKTTRPDQPFALVEGRGPTLMIALAEAVLRRELEALRLRASP